MHMIFDVQMHFSAKYAMSNCFYVLQYFYSVAMETGYFWKTRGKLCATQKLFIHCINEVRVKKSDMLNPRAVYESKRSVWCPLTLNAFFQQTHAQMCELGSPYKLIGYLYLFVGAP